MLPSHNRVLQTASPQIAPEEATTDLIATTDMLKRITLVFGIIPTDSSLIYLQLYTANKFNSKYMSE